MSQVIVYTSTNCPNCHRVKNYLAERGVSYEERNVQRNKEFAQQVLDMGIQVVPVTVIGEQRIPGLNKLQFDKALAEHALLQA
ncbi:glutaredoxin family protein [Paenibacillus woosongensis]|uniref:Glutaredoxin family protein n=1 Tax=Paenibacillus woosongensis TaxID=307580 RepID=A0A7X3CQ16_9BACL|nr:glutaredoxin family protein [Paenibacillus woosongensis]MUG46635.1 glutaredoxin family protein [Paenibacillus woosongensis]